jgi:hypothetical protein
LPGIVAAARGAVVVQTDIQSLALHLAERNGVSIAHRAADWTAWTDGRARMLCHTISSAHQA